MGVKGLSTFVDNNHKLLTHHKLHDCRVIIDGNNFMYYLFLKHRVSFKFGGDYDQYARKCKYFFHTLRACSVKPYVVFDGGYDPDDRKLPTVLGRRLDRIFNVDRISSGQHGSVLPILAIETFQQTLEELDIPHVSCEFEADREIAVLAYKWRCPVLSNDSDFFVYNLEGGVIPLEYMNLTLCTCDMKTGETLVLESSDVLSNNQFKYIPVKLYHYSRFSEKYPQNVRHLVLPVFASLLGNDYVEARQLSSFYSHVVLPCGQKLKFKIVEKDSYRMRTSLHWLDTIQPKKNMFDGVLEYIPEDIRQEVGIKLDRSLNDYCVINNFASIDLEQFFKCYDVPKLERNLESFVFPELREFYHKSIPEWIVSALRRCKMNHKIQNAIVLHRVIQYCQIELLSERSTYQSSRRIREVMYGLFFPQQTSDLVEKKPSRESHIVEYDRNRKNIKKFYVLPAGEINGLLDKWDIYMTPDEGNRKNRLEILFAAVNSTDYTIPESKTISNTMQLLIFMLAMWVKRADPKVSKGALMSLLTTILYLNARAFLWYKNKLEIGSENIPQPCIIDDVEEACNQSQMHKVQHFVDRMEKFTRKPDKKDRKSKDYRKVHGFSQFQAILMDTIQLNQLLACPVPMLSPGFMYSGTTVYSLCADIDYRSKPDLFIGELMALKSPLHELFKVVLQTVINICTEGPLDTKLDQSNKKSKKKKRKKKSGSDTVMAQDHSSDDDTPAQPEIQVVSDLNMDNRFAMLNMEA